MKVQITLNAGVPFWFLPSGALHLSEEAPGPIEIDFSLMSKEEQKLIILGNRNRSIVTSEHDSTLVAFFSKDESPPIAVAQPVPVEAEEVSAPPVIPIDDENVLAAKAQAILNKSNATIKKEMGSSDDIRLVRVMLNLEKQNKNRKAIVSLLESRLAYFANKIQDTIESNDAPVTKVDALDPLASAMEVVDSEVEERKIDLD